MAPLPSPKGNPFVWQMAHQLERNGCDLTSLSVRAAGRADVLHIHWPDHFVNRATAAKGVRGAVKVVLCCLLVRVRGRAVVWTVHNLKPHDARHGWLERAFWPVFTSLLSGCVYLTAAGRSAALERFPRLRAKPSPVIAHGSYAGVYPDVAGGPEEARARLGLPAGSAPLLFFGQIRPYKNVPALLDAFASVGDAGARMVVAGDGPDGSLMADLRRKADQDPRVVLTGRVADEDVQSVFAAAVGAVLPFRDVFNSGSLFLALSLDRPVLVPRTSVFAEIRDQVGAAWITFFSPPLTPGALVAFAEHAAGLTASGARPDMSAYAWEDLGAQIVTFYRALLAGTATVDP
jgi:glycosyltransferase involved in cell wall biosynthesis